MKHREYALGNTVVSPRGRVTASLLENGSMIASVTRPAPGRWVEPYQIGVWFSQQARARFDDFCDCLSMSEALEAISPLIELKIVKKDHHAN